MLFYETVKEPCSLTVEGILALHRPSVGRREGTARRHKLHIPCFPANGKASSLRCGSLPNQSQCFDLERKNGGADTEPSRLSAAAAWSKPILTMPHMSLKKQISIICPVGQTLRGRTSVGADIIRPRRTHGLYCRSRANIVGTEICCRGDPRKAPVIEECSTWEAVSLKHKWTMSPTPRSRARRSRRASKSAVCSSACTSPPTARVTNYKTSPLPTANPGSWILP